MKVNRTTLFAALIAAGVATGAAAQSTSPAPGGSPGKAATPPATQTSPATPAPPATGTTGMDKGAGTGAAPARPSKATTAASSLSRSERRFIEKAARGGMEELEQSKLAMDKAQNPQVRELAKRIVDDHSKANAELMKLASAKGVTAPATMEGSERRNLERLAKKTGTGFDREYTDDMVDEHQKDVREFRSMAKSSKDADLKAFAASTLPTLEQHLQMAKATESAVKKAGRDTAGSGSSTTRAAAPSGTTGGGPTGTARSTATPGKNTAATTGTAGPGTGMPASSTQSTGTAPQPPGSASDTKTTSPAK